MAAPTGLDALNATTDAEAAGALAAVCASQAWADAVAAQRPYRRPSDLYAVADAALAALAEADVDEALAGHPRIGERSASAASQREQAGVGDDVRVALADANVEYEARFGHVYLVCASGRSGTDLLELLRERLGNDPATERRVLRGELAAINRIRLRRLVEGET